MRRILHVRIKCNPMKAGAGEVVVEGGVLLQCSRLRCHISSRSRFKAQQALLQIIRNIHRDVALACIAVNKQIRRAHNNDVLY